MCLCPVEDRLHFTLICLALSDIRETYMKQFSDLNANIKNIKSPTEEFLIALLDPFSPKVSADIREGWTGGAAVYAVSRNYFAAIHKRRKGLMEKNERETEIRDETEPRTDIVISLYSQ